MRTHPIITQHDLQILQGRKKRRILVAEDNLVNQKMTTRMLDRSGDSTDVVGDGR